MLKKKLILTISVFIILVCGYYFITKIVSNIVNKGEYRVTNIKIFINTPVWNLAKAVNDQNTNVIEQIAKEKPELLNYKDPKYNVSLLLWSVGMEKYKSCEALLKGGANPNIVSEPYGESPLFVASGFSWVDNQAKEDPKYVKLLLKYGANPNINYIGSDDDTIEPGTSPLMNSIGSGIEKTKALVEGGANINYKTKSGDTAANKALGRGGPNATIEGMEYAHYLIVEKKAKITDPYYRTIFLKDEDPNKKFYPVNTLRSWTYDLDSKEYKIKMEIVQEFERQGADYWSTKIPNPILEKLKEHYPDTWEEYIKKY
jgi:hypothetical protein